jgi:hypothetical protein
MTTIDRNPDIDLDNETIPEGYFLHEGKRLQDTARLSKIPFGVAHSKRGADRRITHGLVLRNEDRNRFIEALERKELNAKRKSKQ